MYGSKYIRTLVEETLTCCTQYIYQAPSATFQQHWHSRSVDIRNGFDLVLVNLVEKRSEDPPGLGQLVRPHKVSLLTGEDVQEQSLVGIREVEVSVAVFVGQVQLTLHRFKGHTGLLQVHLGINCLHIRKT